MDDWTQMINEFPWDKSCQRTQTRIYNTKCKRDKNWTPLVWLSWKVITRMIWKQNLSKNSDTFTLKF